MGGRQKLLCYEAQPKTIERGSNHVEEKNTTFSYDNPRLTFAIPQNESINNLNL